MTLATLPPAVTPEVTLMAAVDALLTVPSVELAPAQALERLGTVLTETERLAVVALDGVLDIDQRELFALDGAGSTAGWLRSRRVGGSPGMRAFARRLAECPGVRAAMVAGRLGTAAAQQVCAALAEVPAQVDEDNLRGVLIDGAQQLLTEMFGGAADAGDVAELTGLCAAAVDDRGLSAAARLEPVWVFLAQKVAPAALSRVLRDLTAACYRPGSMRTSTSCTTPSTSTYSRSWTAGGTPMATSTPTLARPLPPSSNGGWPPPPMTLTHR